MSREVTITKNTKLAGVKKIKWKKTGEEIILDTAKVLIFPFDALNTLGVAIGQMSHKGNLGKETRAWLFIAFGIAYIIFAAAALAAHKCYAYYKRQGNYLTCWKEAVLMLLEVAVIVSITGYYVGDNLSDTEILPEEKRKTVSTVIIVGGLVGLYSFKFLHGLTESYKEKEEKLIEKSLKEGRFSESQWGERKMNKRNAKVYRIIYEFILEVFGLVPLIDGAYTALLENDDPCENGNTNYFYDILWSAWGGILLGLVIYSIIRVCCMMRQLTRQVIKIEQMKVTNFKGKLENFGGTTTTTHPGNESEKIEIKRGATKSKGTMQIQGKTITILGGKVPNGQNGGTTVIRDGQITAKGDLVFVDDGSNATITNENRVISNPNGTLRNNVTIGGKTTITDGTTKFTTKKAKISGAEVITNDNPADKISQYPEVYIEKRCGCCCPVYIHASILVAFLSIVCIGLFLVADNLQPLDCGIDPSNIYSNYGLRIAFLVISLIFYIICMALAFIFYVSSEFWFEKLPEADLPQEGGSRRRNGTPRRNPASKGKPGIHTQGRMAATMQLDQQGIQLNQQEIQLNQQGIQLDQQGIQLDQQGIQLNQQGIQLNQGTQGVQIHHQGCNSTKRCNCNAKECNSIT